MPCAGRTASGIIPAALSSSLNVGSFNWTAIMNETNETIRSKVMGIINVLKAGQAFANPGGWKVAQNYINMAAAGAGVAATFVPGLSAVLTPDVISAAAGLLGAINIYITTGSTDKIGL